MLKQFNTALAANSPVDQFVGLFKILEDYYSERSDSKGIASRLKRSKELSKIRAQSRPKSWGYVFAAPLGSYEIVRANFIL